MIEDTQNKMVASAPAKKEFHFAATAEHYAEVVYAETMAEAEDIYHKVKRLISAEASEQAEEPQAPATPHAAAPEPTPEAAPVPEATPLSTPAPDAPAQG